MKSKNPPGVPEGSLGIFNVIKISSSENLSGLEGFIGETADSSGLDREDLVDRRIAAGKGLAVSFWGEIEAVGEMTCPEAVTRVGVAGVGGEKRGRDNEGTDESNVDRADLGRGGRAGGAGDAEG